MRRAIALLSVVAVLLLTGAALAADLTPEPAEFFGEVTVNLGSGDQMIHHDPQLLPGIDVYSNVASAANFGFSSTSFASIFGDEVFMSGTGILDQHVFSIYNGGGANLLTATIAVNFYDAVTSGFLGGYTTNVSLGAGLIAGQYTLVTVTNISPLAINLNVSDIVVTQTMTAHTGASTRCGIASLTPPTIGTSPNTMYINSSTVGPAGFYNIGTAPNFLPANPANRINVLAPVKTEPTTWGKVKSLYR